MMGEEQELRERIADAIAAFFGPDDSPHDAADAVLSLLEERQPCPHVVTGDEGTSYCTLAEEAVTVRDSIIRRYRDGWHDCMEGGKRTWHDYIASNEIGTHEPMSDAEAAFFADTEETSQEDDDA